MTILHHSSPCVQPSHAASRSRFAFWLPLVQAGACLALALALVPHPVTVLLTLLEMTGGAVLAWAINAAGCWLCGRVSHA